jgi:hypothetical protein
LHDPVVALTDPRRTRDEGVDARAKLFVVERCPIRLMIKRVEFEYRHISQGTQTPRQT